MIYRLCFLVCLALGLPRPVLAADDVLALGAELYEEHCTVCHGEAGDGNGPAADRLRNKPRDFRRGIFKFRSTPSGSLPLDADLFRTLTRGIPGTAMLPQTQLTKRERWAVIQYLKEFSPRFRREKPLPPVSILVPTDFSSRVEPGWQLYHKVGCTICHGEQGWGDGPAAQGFKDEWGNPIRPANLTRGPLKSGTQPKDLYRTLSTGLDGTPMPSYQHTLSDEERWALVAYIVSGHRADEDRPHGMMGAKGMGSGEEHLGRMIIMMQGMGRHEHGCMRR